jgi:hypothetical protein
MHCRNSKVKSFCPRIWPAESATLWFGMSHVNMTREFCMLAQLVMRCNSVWLCLQVAEEERKLHLDNIFRDVAGVLAEKCINPDNGRPYTMALLERALKDVHFNVDPKRSAKQQALEVRFSRKPTLLLRYKGPQLLCSMLVQPRTVHDARKVPQPWTRNVQDAMSLGCTANRGFICRVFMFACRHCRCCKPSSLSSVHACVSS